MKNETPTKDANAYLRLPYTVILRLDEEGDYVARIAELEGCVAHGESQADALANLQEVQKAWIEDAIEAGDQIPEPEREEELPSGKWLQRVPRSLHKRLTDIAKKEDISLNQLVTAMLAEAVGKRSATQVSTPASLGARVRYLWVSDYLTDWKVHEPAAARPLHLTEALYPLVTALPNQFVQESEKVNKRVSKKEIAELAYQA